MMGFRRFQIHMRIEILEIFFICRGVMRCLLAVDPPPTSLEKL